MSYELRVREAREFLQSIAITGHLRVSATTGLHRTYPLRSSFPSSKVDFSCLLNGGSGIHQTMPTCPGMATQRHNMHNQAMGISRGFGDYEEFPKPVSQEIEGFLLMPLV